MKPIFAIDITEDKKNDKVNGERFITGRISFDTKSRFEQKSENLEQTVEKSKLPTWMGVAKIVCGFVFLIVLAGTIRSGADLEQAFQNAPWLLISGAVCGVAWAVLQIMSKKKEKEVFTEENAVEQAENIRADIKEIYKELGVPSNARNIDIMTFKYAEKDGKIKVKATGMQMFEYANLDVKAYTRDGYLHLADIESVYSFKLSEIKAIRSVKKHTTLSSWNKDAEPTDKKYKLTVDQYGMIHIKGYHIIEIEQEGEIYGIYFPSYEREAFEMLTGLRAEEEK